MPPPPTHRRRLAVAPYAQRRFETSSGRPSCWNCGAAPCHQSDGDDGRLVARTLPSCRARSRPHQSTWREPVRRARRPRPEEALQDSCVTLQHRRLRLEKIPDGLEHGRGPFSPIPTAWPALAILTNLRFGNRPFRRHRRKPAGSGHPPRSQTIRVLAVTRWGASGRDHDRGSRPGILPASRATGHSSLRIP